MSAGSKRSWTVSEEVKYDGQACQEAKTDRLHKDSLCEDKGCIPCEDKGFIPCEDVGLFMLDVYARNKYKRYPVLGSAQGRAKLSEILCQ